ncbi:MAG: putative metal-binding motif-containing protein [Polyangiaceae bacterium]
MRSSLLTVVVVLFGTVSCSGDEFTGGSGTGGKTGDAGGASGASGSGGVSGSSGSGGGTGGLPADCNDDKDCDDKLACTGVEKCTAGKCVAGAAVTCPNPDGAHCEAKCDEPSGTCVVRGKDADGDQHFDVACKAAATPGDDCDDSNDKVYTGAPEICDGIDNDCNNNDEFADGKGVMKGTAGDFVSAGMRPAIAWGSSAQKYGVVWQNENNLTVQFATMSSTGTKGTTVPLQATDDPPRIAWNGSAFGIVWRSGTAVRFVAYKPDGTVFSAAQEVSDSNAKPSAPDVAGTPTGWTVVWSDKRNNVSGSLYAHLIDGSGKKLQGTDVPVGTPSGVNLEPAIAASGTSMFVAYGRAASGTVPTSVAAFELNGTLGTSNAHEILLPGGTAVHPAVAATNIGWAAAWSATQGASDKIGYYEELTNGVKACSPVAATMSASQPAFAGGVAARGNGRVLVFGQSGATANVQLVRFGPGCSAPSQLKVDDTDVPDWRGFGLPAVAWGEQSAAVLFPDQSGGTTKIRYWISGPNLCDNPVP